MLILTAFVVPSNEHLKLKLIHSPVPLLLFFLPLVLDPSDDFDSCWPSLTCVDSCWPSFWNVATELMSPTILHTTGADLTIVDPLWPPLTWFDHWYGYRWLALTIICHDYNWLNLATVEWCDSRWVLLTIIDSCWLLLTIVDNCWLALTCVDSRRFCWSTVRRAPRIISLTLANYVECWSSFYFLCTSPSPPRHRLQPHLSLSTSLPLSLVLSFTYMNKKMKTFFSGVQYQEIDSSVHSRDPCGNIQ